MEVTRINHGGRLTHVHMLWINIYIHMKLSKKISLIKKKKKNGYPR